jgi:phenylacetate-coenzyme A ligase PaaK-like adenylate-forming protein
LIHLELINDEAVVTSLCRKAMPIIRYRTGDHVVWSSPQAEDRSQPAKDVRCLCGSDDPKFVLLGRVDGQINIWSCRLGLPDIERSLAELDLGISQYQIQLEGALGGKLGEERLLLRLEGAALNAVQKTALKERIYHQAQDLRATHPLPYVNARLDIQCFPVGTLPRFARTGKVKPVIDYR